jgi:hypothetical protein
VQRYAIDAHTAAANVREGLRALAETAGRDAPGARGAAAGEYAGR